MQLLEILRHSRTLGIQTLTFGGPSQFKSPLATMRLPIFSPGTNELSGKVNEMLGGNLAIN